MGDHSTALGAFKTYGENIHMSCPSDTPVTACKWWHDEISTYTGGNTFGGPHYTQMMWKSTTNVGCGKGPASCGGALWVCQSLPAGNMAWPADISQRMSCSQIVFGCTYRRASSFVVVQDGWV